MERLPPLRPDIQFIPFQVEGGTLIAVRDGLGVAAPDLALRPEAGRYLPLFDGRSSLRDLQSAIARDSGGAAPNLEQLAALVRRFDELGLLATERFFRRRAKIVETFTALAERPPALAGQAYPAGEEELAEFLDALLAKGEGGTAPPARVRALAAPHIDFRAAGAAYARAYLPLRERKPSALLLLGTGHALQARYCLTDKDYRTPLGRLPVDGEAVERLRRAGGAALAEDDFVHRDEHSLEFQVLLLQRLFPGEEIPVIPLLCGSLEDLFARGGSPLEEEGIAPLVEALGEWLAGDGGERVAVAGVDLAHVGPKFGDDRPAAQIEEEVRRSDGDILRSLERGEAAGLYDTVAREGNRFRICGFSALWTLLASLPGMRGTVAAYELWHEEATSSAVSFASLWFDGGEGRK